MLQVLLFERIIILQYAEVPYIYIVPLLSQNIIYTHSCEIVCMSRSNLYI